MKKKYQKNKDFEYIQKLQSLNSSVIRYTQDVDDLDKRNMVFDWAINLLNEWEDFYKCEIEEFNSLAEELSFLYLKSKIPHKRGIGY